MLFHTLDIYEVFHLELKTKSKKKKLIKKINAILCACGTATMSGGFNMSRIFLYWWSWSISRYQKFERRKKKILIRFSMRKWIAVIGCVLAPPTSQQVTRLPRQRRTIPFKTFICILNDLVGMVSWFSFFFLKKKGIGWPEKNEGRRSIYRRVYLRIDAGAWRVATSSGRAGHPGLYS